MGKQTLREILDYRSGDSTNGDHDRNIAVLMDEKGLVTIDNHFHGHHETGQFTLQQICSQLGEARDATYYGDFCYRVSQNIPGFLAVRDAFDNMIDITNPSMIEADVKGGVRSDLIVRRPLQLKLKP